MSVLMIMIPLALLLAGLAVAAFVIAVKRGQFDDLDTPALRAVFDDDDLSAPGGRISPTKDQDTPKTEQEPSEDGPCSDLPIG